MQLAYLVSCSYKGARHHLSEEMANDIVDTQFIGTREDLEKLLKAKKQVGD
jgi:hypothetical protein